MRRKKILVTGGHQRLGRAIALHLGSQGADVAITWRRDEAAAQEVVAKLSTAGRPALAVQAELTSRDQVHELIDRVVQRLGGLDAVVCSAASFLGTELDACDTDSLDLSWADNARAPVDLILQARPYLEQSKDGRAVLIGDLAALKPLHGYLGHSMAKAALHNAVMGLAVELAPDILVNAVVPGPVLRPEGMSEEAWQQLLDRLPLGEVARHNPGLPVRAVCEAVRFCLDCPRFMTGQVLVVDGGRSVRW